MAGTVLEDTDTMFFLDFAEKDLRTGLLPTNNLYSGLCFYYCTSLACHICSCLISV